MGSGPCFPTGEFWKWSWKLEVGVSIDSVKKKIAFIFSSDDANILRSYYKHYSKQAHKLLASSDENETTIFFPKVKRKSVFQSLFWKNESRWPIFYGRVVFLILLHIAYIFHRKTYVFWSLTTWIMLLYPTTSFARTSRSYNTL